jgi:hypothetical protein
MICSRANAPEGQVNVCLSAELLNKARWVSLDSKTLFQSLSGNAHFVDEFLMILFSQIPFGKNQL